jgi:chromate transporter
MPESSVDGPPGSASADKGSLIEVALLFLRLGTIAFGGPAAHIAMMEDEVVVRRRWLSREQFLDLLGSTNLIPGPNSTEMAIHIGSLRAGWAGLLVAGCCFILPAVLIVIGLAWMYVRYGSLPQAASLLYGVKPVIITVVLQALWRFGRTVLRNWFLVAIGVGALLLNLLGAHELVVLFGAGLFVSAERSSRQLWNKRAALFAPAAVAHFAAATTATAAAPFGLWPLFLFFLKIGSVLFGSGYVLVAFLRADLVERWGWLTESQLIDAVAVGQVTPGPVFTTATFIGYVLGGSAGAIVATVGIFLPAFVFVAISGPLVPRIRKSEIAGAALDGINVASLSLMAVVTWQLGRSALIDIVTISIFSVSLLLLIRFRLNSAWLVLGGAVIGLLVFQFDR